MNSIGQCHQFIYLKTYLMLFSFTDEVYVVKTLRNRCAGFLTYYASYDIRKPAHRFRNFFVVVSIKRLAEI